MKLHLSASEGTNQITAYGADFVAVNGVRYERSVVVTADAILDDWNVGTLSDLSEHAVGRLAALSPEVVLLGTGARSRFPAATVLRPLIEAGIGYEIMATGAACRTFGVLAGEGRRVLAALILSA